MRRMITDSEIAKLGGGNVIKNIDHWYGEVASFYLDLPEDWNEVIVGFSGSGIQTLTIGFGDSSSSFQYMDINRIPDPDGNEGDLICFPVHIVKTAPGTEIYGLPAEVIIYKDILTPGDTGFCFGTLDQPIKISASPDSGAPSQGLTYLTIVK